MSPMTSRQRDLMDDLRVLAGGKGWLVEEAFQHAGSEPVRLRDVVRYIVAHRLREPGLDADTRRVFESLLNQFDETEDTHLVREPRVHA